MFGFAHKVGGLCAELIFAHKLTTVYTEFDFVTNIYISPYSLKR
jgi:hypothetical protein